MAHCHVCIMSKQSNVYSVYKNIAVSVPYLVMTGGSGDNPALNQQQTIYLEQKNRYMCVENWLCMCMCVCVYCVPQFINHLCITGKIMA